MTRILCTFLFVLCLLGCGVPPSASTGDPDSPKVIHPKDHPSAVGVSVNDTEMNAAMQKARDTWGQFLDFLDNASEGDGAIVKVGVPNSRGVPEYMWVYKFDVEGDHFKGALQEDAFDVPNLKKNDVITFSLKQVGDWVFVHKGKYSGGYTTDLIRAREGK